MRYGIDWLLTEFKGRDSCSVICFMKLRRRWGREAARGGRGGAVEQLWVTSESDVIRAGFNSIARSAVFYFLLTSERSRSRRVIGGRYSYLVGVD